ncbi:MAG: response regulator transcription factor [Clostridia bacterium]|nr:response regulator transcription factor [Clostridia bacterium]
MIYLLEDDDSIRKLVVYALKNQGFETMGFDTPERFWAAMDDQKPDLLLLDIMLPGEDGFTILKRLRAAPDTANLPIMMLTAKNSEYDRVEGLDAGADDYLSKPFGMMELTARVRALLRRSERRTNDAAYCFGTLYVNPERYEVKVADEPVTLTYKEFMLLKLLIEHHGLVLTREVLLDRIWGLGAERENRTLDVHIRTLRSKLGAAGCYIQTVRGVGYRFSEKTL